MTGTAFTAIEAGAARILLKVIDRNPAAVLEALDVKGR